MPKFKTSFCTRRLLLLALCCAIVLTGCTSQDPAPDPVAVKDLQDKAAKGGGAVAAVAKVEGWGKLTGKFVVQGDVPPATSKTISKDQIVCGGHNLKDESVVLGAGNGLANVVVYLKKVPPEQVNPDLAAKEGGEVKLDNKNCRFEPHLCLLTTKDKFLVTNSDPVQHNTNYTGRAGFSESIAPSVGKLEKKFTKRADSPAFTKCDIHPWMDAYVFVLDHPYMAKTKDDGTFTIDDLPAGIDLEFQVWHERPSSKKITAAGQFQVKSGKFKVKIPKDGTLNLGTLTIQASDLLN